MAEFPTTAVLDDFNRSDNTSLGSNWSDQNPMGSAFSTWQILSNVVANQSELSSYGGDWWTPSTFGPASEVYCDVPTLPGTSHEGLLYARIQSPGGTSTADAYGLVVEVLAGTDTWKLARFTDTGVTFIGGTITGPNLTAGDAVGLSVLGPILTAWHRTGGVWSPVHRWADFTYTAAGYIGGEWEAGTYRLDNFGGGTVVNTFPYLVGSGTTPTGTGTGTGTTSCAPNYPTSLEGDLLLMQLHIKPETATAPTVTDWTKVNNGEAAGGGGTTGLDTGPMRLCWYYRVVGSTPPTGSVTVTPGSSPNNCMAHIHCFRGGGADSVWDVEGANGIDSTTGTPFTAAMGANPGIQADDAVIVAGAIPTDVTTPSQFSAETLTATGLTSGPVSEIAEPETTQGNDQGGVTCVWYPTGTASAAATFSATAGGTTTNVRGPICLVRARYSIPTGIEEAVVAALETETAQALARLKARASGLGLETDTAQTIGRGKTKAVTPALETASALSLGRLKAEALAGPALESDAGQALGRLKARALPNAIETDAGQAITEDPGQEAAIVAALEAAAGQALGRLKAKALVNALEADAGIDIEEKITTTVALTPALEADAAITLARLKALAAGRALETDTGQPAGERKAEAAGPALETDTARAPGRSRSRLIVPAIERDEGRGFELVLADLLADLEEQAVVICAAKYAAVLAAQATQDPADDLIIGQWLLCDQVLREIRRAIFFNGEL